ncbi:DNA topoisomerase IV subunit A [Pseudorhodobacter antarcticus]|uniref:DNA topoisomerase 4 subunit A n=2 Tax=Pseudorhodobacter antarcticus TaxID=1077947 RepID=A0A1H8IXP5_9RHOB|nr:DNA topoisomerase IV subunit A [Pseudorhodobacter antarcticus]
MSPFRVGKNQIISLRHGKIDNILWGRVGIWLDRAPLPHYTTHMTKTPDDPVNPPMMVSEPLRRAIGDRYLTYALSTIMHRALPDARDGLKPVHRRILYAMRELKLSPTGGFRKSAKISGDVMGNYHPHGDMAIYDAMARLAQDFAVRYPLVEGQGNFGNIDGDNPAASRYTEARLTAIAEKLMEGLNENAVDYRPNYDGTLEEPVVMPAAFPHLLANGSSGIAVGMATNIPPHNLHELIDACIAMIKDPDIADDALVTHVPGPDFPTGGVIVEPRANISDAYRTGRGAFRLRARWSVEDLGRGQWQIVVTEIPYQVQKSKLIEKLAELIHIKKIPIFGDVRDESAEDVRLIIEPKVRTVDPDMLMGMLFKNSDLEVRFSLNMNTLIDGRIPKVCSLKEVLRAFLSHKRDVMLRRSQHRMDKIDHRLEVLEGFITAFLNLDRVIDIIRYDTEPKPALMRENWSLKHPRAMTDRDYLTPKQGDGELTEVQTEAILNMRLRSLRKLEEMELIAERDALMLERAGLDDLLADPKLQWKRITSDLRDVQKTFGNSWEKGTRRTTFAEAGEVEDVPFDAMIEREPITVICSKMGWIRAMKGHAAAGTEAKFKDGDEGRFQFHAETTDRIILVGSNGRFYTLLGANLPGGRGMGEPVRLMVDLPNDADITDLIIHKPGIKLLVASTDGDGFICPSDETVAMTRAGKQVLTLRGGAKTAVCKPIVGDHIAVVGENRKVLVFPLDELPEMAKGKGVRLQKYKDGGLSDATTFALEGGLSWKDPAGRTRTEPALDEWLAKRATAGRMAPRGFPRDNKFS